MSSPAVDAFAPLRPHPDDAVYRPQEDTRLLVAALADLDLSGRRVLDLCSGSGAVAVAAARAGARVVAVDSCPVSAAAIGRAAHAVGVDVDVWCADLVEVGRGGFDVVTCNPPYVPTPPGTEASAPGPAHAWNAGPDGRAVLDLVCALVPGLLADHGVALVVQSDLADVDASIAALTTGGLRARIVAEEHIPFGPVTTSRRIELVDAGILRSDADRERIVVVRADGGPHDR